MRIPDFLDQLSRSPSPFHAVDTVAGILEQAGFRSAATDADELDPQPGFVRRGGLLIGWAPLLLGTDQLSFRIIGAHTDSPNLRIKPRADRLGPPLGRLAAEPYGGVLLNSWLDRDLGLSGRVVVANAGSIEERLFVSEGAVARVPQLAIHLDREVNSKGLILDPQTHMNLLWSTDPTEPGDFTDWLADMVGCDPAEIVGWDAMAHDVVPPSVWGVRDEFLSSSRLDNLCSTFGATAALAGAACTSGSGDALGVIAFFDHEEVGSTTSDGATSSTLLGVLTRLAAASGVPSSQMSAVLARSALMSADMAHAIHPNYPERHEASHPVSLGAGPVIKTNVAQRYATDAVSGGRLVQMCRSAGVPTQTYVHRADMSCGSTIGPHVAAALGMPAVDVGIAQLSMHSIRETMAVADLAHQHTMMSAWFGVTPR